MKYNKKGKLAEWTTKCWGFSVGFLKKQWPLLVIIPLLFLGQYLGSALFLLALFLFYGAKMYMKRDEWWRPGMDMIETSIFGIPKRYMTKEYKAAWKKKKKKFVWRLKDDGDK